MFQEVKKHQSPMHHHRRLPDQPVHSKQSRNHSAQTGSVPHCTSKTRGRTFSTEIPSTYCSDRLREWVWRRVRRWRVQSSRISTVWMRCSGGPTRRTRKKLGILYSSMGISEWIYYNFRNKRYHGWYSFIHFIVEI